MAAAAVVLTASALTACSNSGGSIAGLGPAKSAAKAQDGQGTEGHPRVDIVFALDTTASMSGLIDGAKAKIWEIAKKAQEGKPSPEVRVGLVAYRDKGDAYVTKIIDLTGDLDTIYSELRQLQAAGGGDGPEHVLKGLNDAVNEVHWSSDPNAVKLVYLVGDAPPHEDYDDGLTMRGVVRDALQRGVRISAIRCGTDEDTLAKWTAIAVKTDGVVSTIEQNGGVLAAVVTPYDAELARLNAELAKTEVHFGTREEQAKAADVVAANMAAPNAAQADRAGFYAARKASKPGAAPMKKDLTASAKPAPAAIAAVKEDELPENMKKMSPAERAKFVEEKRAEREAVLKRIQVASGKRDAALKAAPKPRAASDSFDAKVMDSLKKAGADKGISY
jgi:hypothetical protein